MIMLQLQHPAPIWDRPFKPNFDEMCFYQYLPVKMANDWTIRIPKRLMPFADLVTGVAYRRMDYVYLTVKRGWATTENPLNRPGWHIDAWGQPDDMNYVWCDKYPTVYVTGIIPNLPDATDAEWLDWFEECATLRPRHEVEPGHYYRFGHDVLHTTPIITEPGLRTFAKVSVSPHRYNLKGNSHNHLFDYKWEMVDRTATRNDPIASNRDYV